jgi:hypothetical protein
MVHVRRPTVAMNHLHLHASLLCALALPLAAQDQPEKIGGITFTRDLDQALALSKQDGKPVVAYFTFDT